MAGKIAGNVPEFLGRAYKLCLRHKMAVIIAFAILLLTIIFTSEMRKIVSILLLATAGAFGQVYRRSIRIPPAVEFVTFGTVLVGYSYGPWAGAIFGIVVTLIAEIMSSTIDAFVIGYVPSRAAIGIISSFLTGHGIASVGIWMTIAYNVLAQPLYLLQPDAELRLKLVFFVTGNIIFNIMLFKLLAEPVLFLMG
ncbi:MAG: hypothetical protein V1702_05165 [Candidatus Woesearchaeota archaeon]